MSVKSELTSLANAIRSKTGTSGKLTISGMTDAVAKLEVGSGGGIDFYECTSYTPDFAGGVEYSFILSGAADEAANGNYACIEMEDPVDEYDEEYRITAVWENENGYKLVEHYSYGEFHYEIRNAGDDTLYQSDGAVWSRPDTFPEYGTYIPWADLDWMQITLTFADGPTTEIPPTTESWSGRKVVQDTETGLWSRTDTVKENMTAPFFTPQVGMVYSEDTSIACSAVFDAAAGHLEALYHFDNETIDATGKTKITSIGEGWYKSNSDAKFGTGSMEADCYISASGYTSYYLDISGLPEMDAFTIEWWQKDNKSYGDGGYVLSQPETDDLPLSLLPAYKIPQDSSDYLINIYRHWAFVRKANSSTVDVYLNGKKMGSVEFAAKLGGRLVKFSGVSSYSGTQVKDARIDELAIYSTAKYTSDFTPSNGPIVT